MVQTNFDFVLLKNNLDGPSRPADAHELGKGRFDLGITNVELDHGLVVQITTDDQPQHFRTRQISTRFNQVKECETSYNWTLAALFESSCAPTKPRLEYREAESFTIRHGGPI
jgi:hypothetical protein